MIIKLLLVFLLCLPSSSLWASRESRSRIIAPESDAKETNRIEFECVRLEKEIKASPDDAELLERLDTAKEVLYKRHLRAAKELEGDGYWLAALGHYQKALLYRPGEKRASEALAKLKAKMAELDRKDSEKAYQEGLKAYVNGNRIAAEESWKRALSLNPKNEQAQAALEELNAKEDSLKKSLEKAEESVPQEPELKESLWDQNYRAGNEHLQFGEYEEAIKYYKRALKYLPNDETTRQQLAKTEGILEKRKVQKSRDFYWLGVKALQSSDFERAYLYLIGSMEADENNKEAQKLLADLIRKRPEVLKSKSSPAQSVAPAK